MQFCKHWVLLHLLHLVVVVRLLGLWTHKLEVNAVVLQQLKKDEAKTTQLCCNQDDCWGIFKYLATYKKRIMTKRKNERE